MKRIVVFPIFAIAFTLISSAFFAENARSGTTLRYTLGSAYYLVERSNWSKYVNGAYVGLTHRETRANVNPVPGSGDEVRFSGFFYVLEETLRDMSKSARGLDETREAAFTVSPDGRMRFTKDPGYPALREFPVYPAEAIRPGDRWQAAGTRIVDPRNDGKRSALPIMVEYEFVGAETWQNRDVYRIRAKFATRIDKYLKLKTDDPDLKSATGTHDVEILVDAETGAAVLTLDRLDETFFYADGGSVRYRGNTALFTEAPVPIDHTTLIPQLSGISERKGSERGAGSDDAARKSAAGSGSPTEDTFPGITPEGNKSLGKGTERPPANADQGDRPDRASSSVPAEGDAGGEPFKVEETPQGIRLSVRDIRFVADSDAIVPGESWRLDAIADALKLVPNGKFLVEGHTASVGKPGGEKELSVARAKKIVDELARRGLLPERFIYSGYGGTKPIADNGTAAGRAQNRRVEITILE